MKPCSFPQPVKLGPGANKWALSDILAFEARRAGHETPELSPDQERWLSTADVCERLSIGRTTLWRWVRESAEVAA